MVIIICMSYCVSLMECIYVFFFFFKQKTAYEMRISDWSSDVCSSDLVGVNCIVPAAETRLAEGRDTAGFPPWGPELVAPAVGWQIGRASCRERVCQYV